MIASSMFPAPAGMSQVYDCHGQNVNNVPRTCGDEPLTVRTLLGVEECSPHLRG